MTRPPLSRDEARFVRLSWALIEYKVMYYLPDRVHESRRADLTIPDETYDALERKYLGLCIELGKPNTVLHKSYPDLEAPGYGMMEVDETRPSVQLVMEKLATELETDDEDFLL